MHHISIQHNVADQPDESDVRVDGHGVHYKTMLPELQECVLHDRDVSAADDKRQPFGTTGKYRQLAPGCIVYESAVKWYFNRMYEYDEVFPSRRPRKNLSLYHQLVKRHDDYSIVRVNLNTLGGPFHIPSMRLSLHNTFHEFLCILDAHFQFNADVTETVKREFSPLNYRYFIEAQEWMLPTSSLRAVATLAGTSSIYTDTIERLDAMQDVTVSLVARPAHCALVINRYCILSTRSYPSGQLCWERRKSADDYAEPMWDVIPLPPDVLAAVENLDVLAMLINWNRISMHRLVDQVRNTKEFYFKVDIPLPVFLEKLWGTSLATVSFVTEWCTVQIAMGRKLDVEMHFLREWHFIFLETLRSNPWILFEIRGHVCAAMFRSAFSAGTQVCVEYWCRHKHKRWKNNALEAMDWLVLCKPNFKAQLPPNLLPMLNSNRRRATFWADCICNADTASDADFNEMLTKYNKTQCSMDGDWTPATVQAVGNRWEEAWIPYESFEDSDTWLESRLHHLRNVE